jgi:hypothetical protein
MAGPLPAIVFVKSQPFGSPLSVFCDLCRGGHTRIACNYGQIPLLEQFAGNCVIPGTATASELNDSAHLRGAARQGARVMFDPFAPGQTAMALQTITTSRDDRLAYVKAMRSEDVAFLSADAPMLAPGHRVFVVCAADGRPILLADSHASAIADATDHQIVSLH